MGRVVRPVRCLETGAVFQSARDAARHHGVIRQMIYESIHRGYAAAGYTWAYVDAEQEAPRTQFHKRRRVRWVDEDRVFDSVAAAARETGVSLHCIYQAISRGRRGLARPSWEYVETRRALW